MKARLMLTLFLTSVLLVTGTGLLVGQADAQRSYKAPKGLLIPQMDAKRGRTLFGQKGCVICHSVNSVGGEHMPFDVETMEEMPMNAFEFAARMWRGAEPMIALQQEQFGYQIDLTGQELGDIIAFVHSIAEQKKFSLADVPEEFQEILEHMEDAESGGHHHEMGTGPHMGDTESGGHGHEPGTAPHKD